MSRAPLSPQSIGKRPGAALAIQKAGDLYRYVVASGGGGGSPVRVTDCGTVPASDLKALESLRQRAGGSAAFVQVIPPDAAILRPAPPKLVLDGTPEQIASALSLVAEAELPATVPAHRRAAGVLRAGHAHAVYAVGWIGPDGTVAPEATPVPAVAALGALFRLTGAPEGLMVYTDRATGVVAAIGAAPGESPRLFVRVLRDDASDPTAFDAVRDEAVDDARATVDAQPPVTAGPALLLPRRTQVPGLAGDDRLSEFALVLGAAAFILDAKPDELPLTVMTDRSATAGRSILTRVAGALSTPRALAVTAAACVCLMLTGWIVAAPARLALLQKRVGNDTGDYAKAVQQHDWYKALHERRWPLTALIAELTSGAPEGVRVESFTIEQGRPVTLTGTAETAGAVDTWCKSLRGKVFTDVERTIPQEDVSPVRFTLKASVVDALAAVVSDIKPIASTDTPHTKSDTPASSGRTERADRNTRTTGTRTNSARNNTRTPGGAAAAAPGASKIAPPISDAQIAKLDLAGARNEWALRKGQLYQPDLDGAVRTRMETEAAHLRARVEALGGGQ